LIAAIFIACSSALAVEERAINFIFLIDVSGSMLSKSTMVTASDGRQVTLFEALRTALEQIVQDKRLIGPSSKVAFITFGTTVEPKTDWPTKLGSEEDRQKLLAKITSPEALQADKHGDTYMGGALSAALMRANSMFAESDPCTSTFIVMLTDGWDEPPHGANLKVRDVASQLRQREQQIIKQTGYETWHVMVVGLQRLPDRKAGTTTAKELAEILGGGFIDVSKQANGTVSDRIVTAIKAAVENLQGSISFLAAPTSANENQTVEHAHPEGGVPPALSQVHIHEGKQSVIDFGTVNGDGNAKAEMTANLHSCYGEDVDGVSDVSRQLSASETSSILAACQKIHGQASVQPVAKLQSGALTIKLAQPQYQLAPAGKSTGPENAGSTIGLMIHASSNCPAGYFAGAMHLVSSAKTPKFLPYIISVPGRLVADPEELHVKLKKPGFFFAEQAETVLEGSIKQLPGTTSHQGYDIVVHPQAAELKQASGAGKLQTIDQISENLINDGKAVTLRIEPEKAENQKFKMNIAIPGKQTPGTYKGKLKLDVHGVGDSVAPSEIPFDIELLPSAWEHIEPVAIPIGIIFLLSCGFGIYLWVANPRRD
jgi:Mg-chelatase subunit ChlD